MTTYKIHYKDSGVGIYPHFFTIRTGTPLTRGEIIEIVKKKLKNSNLGGREFFCQNATKRFSSFESLGRIGW